MTKIKKIFTKITMETFIMINIKLIKKENYFSIKEKNITFTLNNYSI